LKQQQLQTAKKNKFQSWFWLLLLLISVATVAVLIYQRQELRAPQRLFSKAAKQESLGDVVAAQELYQRLYQKYRQSELSAEALLRSGRIWQYDRQQDQRALLSYLQLEHDFPDHPQVQPALEAAAHIIKFSLHDYSRAIGYYQRLLELPAGNRDQYLYEIADCYFRLDNYSQARIELETLIREHQQSPLLPDAMYRKGGLQLLDNRLTAAREDWQQLIDQFPDSSYSVQARFNLAKLLEEEDRLQDALESYRQLEGFPRPAMLQEKIEHLKQRIAAKKKAL
jgi:tetratricopeptide (TPR) repeat protein